MNFDVPADYRVKIKKSEKINKYLLNMRVTVIPIVAGALGTVPKRRLQIGLET